MSKFYFLELSLEFDGTLNQSVDKETFKNTILYGIENVFGEFATCFPIDIICYDSCKACGVLRCPDTFYVKLRAALTLTGEYQNRNCCFNISKVSSKLISSDFD